MQGCCKVDGKDHYTYQGTVKVPLRVLVRTARATGMLGTLGRALKTIWVSVFGTLRIVQNPKPFCIQDSVRQPGKP